MVAGAPADRRKQLIRIFTFLGGVYFFLYFVLPESIVESTGIKASHESISNGFIAIGAMAIGLGLFNLVQAHGSRLIFRRKGWICSTALLGGLCAMLAVTIAQWRQSLALNEEIRRIQIIGEFAQQIIDDVESKKEPLPLPIRVSALARYSKEELAALSEKLRSPEITPSPLGVELQSSIEAFLPTVDRLSSISGNDLSVDGKSLLVEVVRAGGKLGATQGALLRQEASGTTVQQLYNLLYEGLFNQLGSAMFALLGVYIAAAAYRAFRIKTVESGLMMAAALVVMLGQISLGHLISDELPAARQWLLEVPNAAAFRAIRLGASVAGLMLAIRMWLSIEPKSFSGGKK